MQRLSGLDAAFLALETPTAHMHVLGVAVGQTDPTPCEDYSDNLHYANLIFENVDDVFSSSCVVPPEGILEWACDNGLDDDNDGLVDFDDPDCAGAPGNPNG